MTFWVRVGNAPLPYPTGTTAHLASPNNHTLDADATISLVDFVAQALAHLPEADKARLQHEWQVRAV